MTGYKSTPRPSTPHKSIANAGSPTQRRHALQRKADTPTSVAPTHPATDLRPDMESGLSSGHGEAVSATVAVDTASLAGWPSGDERVGCRRVVSLIFAGWLPQDGTFESEWSHYLGSSVIPCGTTVLLIAGSWVTPRTLADNHLDSPGHLVGGQSCRTANDQHQPANSRAMAVLATTGRFSRASKPTQR